MAPPPPPCPSRQPQLPRNVRAGVERSRRWWEVCAQCNGALQQENAVQGMGPRTVRQLAAPLQQPVDMHGTAGVTENGWMPTPGRRAMPGRAMCCRSVQVPGCTPCSTTGTGVHAMRHPRRRPGHGPRGRAEPPPAPTGHPTWTIWMKHPWQPRISLHPQTEILASKAWWRGPHTAARAQGPCQRPRMAATCSTSVPATGRGSRDTPSFSRIGFNHPTSI